MKLIIFVFMVLVAVICLFTIVVTISDMIKERKKEKQKLVKQQQKEELQKQQLETLTNEITNNVLKALKEDLTSTIVDTIKDNLQVPTLPNTTLVKDEDSLKTNTTQNITNNVETVVLKEDSVLFSSNKNQTLKEKYNALSDEQKGFYDEIASYAYAQKGVKVIENAKYDEYKIGNNKLIKLEVKRGVVIANFVFVDADRRKYARENKISVKQKATPVKIETTKDVQFAKDSIDLIVKDIEEDMLAKKEWQKEKRRQKAKENKINN